MRKIPLVVVGAAASLAVVAVAVPAGAASRPTPRSGFKVVASNLNNPRQLNFSSRGRLYIAEAGAGGANDCTIGGEGSTVCQGATGSVTVVANGHQHRVLTGLPSYGDQDTGQSALGPADVVPYGKHSLAVSIGYGLDPAQRSSLAAPGRLFGTLLHANLSTHTVAKLGDLAAFEGTHNPIHDPNSDPTGVAKRGKSWVVTDSGGNDMVKVTHHHVSLMRVFHDVTTTSGKVQAVPTDVVVGPDGALYVSELTGFPFVKGAASIYRIVPGHKPQVYASGLTNVTSLAFGPDRHLYAVQIANQGLQSGPTGSLWRVASDKSGHKTRNVSGPLFAPYGVAIKGQSAYVTTGAVVPSGGPQGAPTGQVIKIPLP
jgi:hypothetical protein